jgi:steroid delta-isomerase-like uncharacterized protein
MSVAENKDLLERVIVEFNNMADRTGYFQLYHSDCVLHGYPPGLSPGLEGAKQFYHSLWNAFPDSNLVIEDVIAEGDRVACRYILHGTHKADFMGIPASGTKIALRGMTILRFVNGKCAERWQALDELGLMQQLGAIPAPGGK